MKTITKSFLALSILSLVIPFSCAAYAEPTIPDTPAGRAFEAWFAAINSADQTLVRKYDDTYHRQMTVEQALASKRMTGGLTVLRIEKNESTSLVVLLADHQTDALTRATFAVSADDPFKIVALTLMPNVPRPTEFAIPRLTQPKALQELITRADALVAENRFSGAILIAQDRRVVLEKTWGLANREIGTPITSKTKFRLGSMSKMFTAIAVLQLSAQGKLSLDGTVGTYLPDYPNKDMATKETIRELLTHTGGTGDIFGPEFDANRLSLKTHADYVKIFGARAPEFEPGTQDRYSNYGFILLGAIIERVSGSYYDYVQKNIFAPAGMKDTGSLPESDNVPDRSNGYTWKGEHWISNTDTLGYRGGAAGGGYSTLGDLLNFTRALQDGRLLPKQWLAEATTPHDHGNFYGYGFETRGEGMARLYGHGGGAPGMSADLRIYPELGTVAIALSNLDPPIAPMLLDFYDHRMPMQR